MTLPKLANPRLVAQLQRITEDSGYNDRAFLIIEVPTGGHDSYNNPTTTTSNVPLDCSFTDKPTRELWKDYADIEQVEAEIRFKGHDPKKGQQIKLASRFGDESYKDKTFEIIGFMDRGEFGYVCALKAVSV